MRTVISHHCRWEGGCKVGTWGNTQRRKNPAPSFHTPNSLSVLESGVTLCPLIWGPAFSPAASECLSALGTCLARSQVPPSRPWGLLRHRGSSWAPAAVGGEFRTGRRRGSEGAGAVSCPHSRREQHGFRPDTKILTQFLNVAGSEFTAGNRVGISASRSLVDHQGHRVEQHLGEVLAPALEAPEATHSLILLPGAPAS